MGGGGTQTVENKLSKFQEEFLRPAFERFEELQDVPREYISPGYVGPGADYGASLDMIRDRATHGDAAINAGRGTLTDIAGGAGTDVSALRGFGADPTAYGMDVGGAAGITDFGSDPGGYAKGLAGSAGLAGFGADPSGYASGVGEATGLSGFGDGSGYLDTLTKSIADRVQPAVQSAFGGAGRLSGGSGAQEAMAGAMARELAPYMEAERGRGLAASQTMAGLSEAERGRGLASSQFTAGLGEAERGRGYGASQGLMGLMEGERGRGFGAARDIVGASAGDLDRRLQGAALSPAYAGLAYQDAAALQGLDAQARAEEMQRRMEGPGGVYEKQFQQDEERQRVMEMVNAVMGIVPAQRVTSGGGGGPSPLMSIAGLGLAGLGTAGALGWAPFAAGAAGGAGAAPGMMALPLV